MTDPMAPGLLLAMPQLQDPAFARTVVLVVGHDSQQGSFGLVLNRPTDIPLARVLEEAGLDWALARDQFVWDGGPVTPGPQEPDGFILHHPQPAKEPDADGDAAGGFLVYPFPPPAATLDLLATEAPERVRFFMGYAAWSPGQLEVEILKDAWMLAPADPLLVFGTPCDQMWEAGYHSLGVDPTALFPSSGLH